MPQTALWERLRPATLEELEQTLPYPFVGAEAVLDTFPPSGYPSTIFTVGVGVFTLSGKVTDSATAKAIGGVLATLDTKKAATTEDGSYSFANLTAQTYRVVFAKTGYQSVTKTITVSKDTVLNIQMTPIGVPPPEKKVFPWWILGVAGGAIVVVAVAATAKKKAK